MFSTPSNQFRCDSSYKKAFDKCRSYRLSTLLQPVHGCGDFFVKPDCRPSVVAHSFETRSFCRNVADHSSQSDRMEIETLFQARSGGSFSLPVTADHCI